MGIYMHKLMALYAVTVPFMAQAGVESDPDLGIEFVTVGDVNNLPYEEIFGDKPDGRGSVSYEYRIGKTEITCGQYLEFFNNFYHDFDQYFALLPTGHSSFYWVGPGIPLFYGDGYDDPANVSVQLTWRQAAMFCNWMHNGQLSDWESVLDGAYDVSTFERDPVTGEYFDQATRHPDARYWIPSLDEYLKATFYDPDKNGNGPGWWEFGHRSDVVVVPGLPGEGQVARDIPEDVIKELYGVATENETIPLRLYPEVQSPWGLVDVLGGNTEWIEDWRDGGRTHRLVKNSSNSTRSVIAWIVDSVSNLSNTPPISGREGFRIASAVRQPADLNLDWDVNYFDVAAFVRLYIAGDLSVDFDADGVLTVDDVWFFLSLFQG